MTDSAPETTGGPSAPPGVVAELDALAARWKSTPGDQDAQARLWQRIFGLGRWLFIARGEGQDIRPYATSMDDGPMLMAFTTSERALQGGLAGGLSREEASRILAIPASQAVEWAASFSRNGVRGICWDHPVQGYFALLDNLVAMRDWLRAHPVD